MGGRNVGLSLEEFDLQLTAENQGEIVCAHAE
jgi:hypothetical protein